MKEDLIPVTPYAQNSFITPSGQKVIFIVNHDNHIPGLFRGVRFIPKV
ncbi:hypothetical protein ACFQ3N_15545 [Virgibacillus byunsanensis]|uniref:Uncharacterized protein n=1 Tax=Virgibacillus byunsanensis TaxID=570945 RepID=A0ABW3LPC9_9BACI